MTTESTPGNVPLNDLLGLLARLQSLKVLLGTDSPEVRGWAPVVQQGAQATVNAAIAEIRSAADRVAKANAPDYECEDCIGMKNPHGCYCMAMGARQPGGPAA